MPALDKLSRVADVTFTVARRAGSLAVSTVRQVADMTLERRARSRDRSTVRPPASGRPGSTMPVAPPPAARTPDPPPTAADAPVPTPAAAAAPAEPEPEANGEHVDRDAVVVAEFADEGAEDGAGAQIHVGEPWEGYGSLTAKEVNDRLAAASSESLAVARLYETAHRNRVTVLREIDRRLAAAGSD